MQTDLIGQGLELMLYGMGTVVVFLTLLVFTTSGMSLLVRRFIPAHPAESEGKPLAVWRPHAAGGHHRRHQKTPNEEPPMSNEPETIDPGSRR